MIGLFSFEIAGGEEEVIVDLDRGEVREKLVKKIDSRDGDSADFNFVGGVFGDKLLGVDDF